MIEGRYIGTSGAWVMELRVEMARAGGVSHALSGDVFENDEYRWSFQVRDVAEAAMGVWRGTGNLDSVWNLARRRITVECAHADTTVAQRVLVSCHGVTFPGPTVFEVNWQSPNLRRVLIDVDIEKFVNPKIPPDRIATTLGVQAAFDVELLPDAQKPISLLAVTSPNEPTELQTAWSDAELLEALTSHSDDTVVREDGDAFTLRVWLAMASRHERGSSTYGIMFDRGARRGAAVFLKTIGSSWKRQLFASLHEIGHCFNLRHLGPPTRSWTSNPENGKYPRFFQDFDKIGFTSEQLNHLHHGSFDEVAPGYGPWTLEDEDRLLEHTGTRRSTHVELEAWPAKRVTVLGEPVVVELRLGASDLGVDGKYTVSRLLRPGSGTVNLTITGPDGVTRRFRPLINAYEGTGLIDLTAQLPSIYESVYVGFGADGFYFDQVGRYELQASYDVMDGGLAVSVPTSLYVTLPCGEEERRFSDLFLSEELGVQFGILGSPAPRYRAALDSLSELVDDFPDAPLAGYAHLVRAFGSLRDFRYWESGSVEPITVPADLAGAERHLRTVVRDWKRIGVDRVTLNQVFQALIAVSYRRGREEQAHSYADNMQAVMHGAVRDPLIRRWVENQVVELKKGPNVPRPVSSWLVKAL